MECGYVELNNKGNTGVKDKSDLNTFMQLLHDSVTETAVHASSGNGAGDP
jgi:hypothetical protein